MPPPQAQRLAWLWLLPLSLPQVCGLQSRAGGSRALPGQEQALCLCTGAKRAQGSPKSLAGGLAGAGQGPAGPKGLCPSVQGEVAIWRQTGGEGSVPVSLGRQAQP